MLIQIKPGVNHNHNGEVVDEITRANSGQYMTDSRTIYIEKVDLVICHDIAEDYKNGLTTQIHAWLYGKIITHTQAWIGHMPKMLGAFNKGRIVWYNHNVGKFLYKDNNEETEYLPFAILADGILKEVEGI